MTEIDKGVPLTKSSSLYQFRGPEVVYRPPHRNDKHGYPRHKRYAFIIRQTLFNEWLKYGEPDNIEELPKKARASRKRQMAKLVRYRKRASQEA